MGKPKQWELPSLEDFCRARGAKWVETFDWPHAKSMRCFQTVSAMVQAEGGEAVGGWRLAIGCSFANHPIMLNRSEHWCWRRDERLLHVTPQGIIPAERESNDRILVGESFDDFEAFLEPVWFEEVPGMEYEGKYRDQTHIPMSSHPFLAEAARLRDMMHLKTRNGDGTSRPTHPPEARQQWKINSDGLIQAWIDRGCPLQQSPKPSGTK